MSKKFRRTDTNQDQRYRRRSISHCHSQIKEKALPVNPPTKNKLTMVQILQSRNPKQGNKKPQFDRESPAIWPETFESSSLIARPNLTPESSEKKAYCAASSRRTACWQSSQTTPIQDLNYKARKMIDHRALQSTTRPLKIDRSCIQIKCNKDSALFKRFIEKD